MFNTRNTGADQKETKKNGISWGTKKHWWQYDRPSYGYGWLFILFYYSQINKVWNKADLTANPYIVIIGLIITFFIYFKARKRFVNKNDEITWLSSFIGNIVGLLFTLVYLWTLSFVGILFM